MGMRAPLPLTQRPQVVWCGTELTRLATSEGEILCFKLLRSHNSIDIMISLRSENYPTWSLAAVLLTLLL